MAENYLKCNWAVWCADSACPHFHPHLSHPIPHKNNQPQCEDEGTYCHAEEKSVNCVPVKLYPH